MMTLWIVISKIIPGFCPHCGEGKCECEEDVARMSVSEEFARIFSPNIPVYSALTDFSRWRVWRIEGEPRVHERSMVTEVEINAEPLLTAEGINLPVLQQP
jgi:hypothetical protein